MSTPDQYLAGLESAYMWRGRLRLNAYGLRVTRDKLIGFKVPTRTFAIAITASIILATLAVLISARNLMLAVSLAEPSSFESLLGSPAGPLVYLSLTPLFLSSYIADKMMKRTDVGGITEARTPTDFELKKDDIRQVEVRRGRDMKSGRLFIRLKEGGPIEVKIGGFTGRSPETLVQVMGLIDKFWGKGPDERSSNYELWRH